MDIVEIIQTLKTVGKLYVAAALCIFVIRGYICAQQLDSTCTANVIVDIFYWWLSPLLLAAQIGGIIGLFLILYWMKNN